jgi:predicted Zn-dependent protease
MRDPGRGLFTGDFEGGAFHPELPGGRAAGRLRVDASCLELAGAPRTLRLDVAGIDVRLGGARNRVVFFTHASQPNLTLYTSDHAILSHPALTGSRAVAAQLAAARSRRHLTRLATWGSLAAVVAAIVGLYAARNPLADAAASAIPIAAELRLGEVAFGEISRGLDMIEDPAVEAELATLVAPLLGALAVREYPFDFHVVRDGSLNAFAVPGGNVVLHSGLLLEAESAAEVQGVLAHELAHITRRHTLRLWVRSIGLYLLVDAFVGDVGGLAAVLSESGGKLLSLKFSREFELEADDVGWALLERAAIDPRGLVAFLERLRAMESDLERVGLDSAVELLSTHPATLERVERLRARLGARVTPPADTEVDAALERLRGRLRELGGGTSPPADGSSTKDPDPTTRPNGTKDTNGTTDTHGSAAKSAQAEPGARQMVPAATPANDAP